MSQGPCPWGEGQPHRLARTRRRVRSRRLVAPLCRSHRLLHLPAGVLLPVLDPALLGRFCRNPRQLPNLGPPQVPVLEGGAQRRQLPELTPGACQLAGVARAESTGHLAVLGQRGAPDTPVPTALLDHGQVARETDHGLLVASAGSKHPLVGLSLRGGEGAGEGDGGDVVSVVTHGSYYTPGPESGPLGERGHHRKNAP